MNPELDLWQDELSNAIASALKQFRAQISEPIQMFSIDCHPWNGVIALAILTLSEFANDPLLAGDDEMAAWKFYNFAERLPSRLALAELAAQMRRIYDNAKDKENVTVELWQCCGNAVASRIVQKEVLDFDLARGFKISISDPDSGAEYYLGEL